MTTDVAPDAGSAVPVLPFAEPTLGPRFALVVLGDVRVEFRASIRDRSFVDLVDNHFGYGDVDVCVSGTAINFARQARPYFRIVDVIGKIGQDEFTPLIEREVQRLGLRDGLRVEPGMRNGFTLMLRDRPAAASSSGVRLLVASEPAPVQTLSAADVGAVSARIVDADLLFVDGYVLLSTASRQSARLAVELAREHGTLVALDLVPHDIDRRIGLPALMPLLSRADLVVSDARTVAGLFGVPSNGTAVDFDRLLPALDTALPSFPLWLLRHGDGGMQDTLAYQNGRMKTSYETGYTTATEKAGFGDVIAARELHGWLSAAKG